MSHERLTAELDEDHVYEVAFESRKYQVELEHLENTGRHIHVTVSVDDGGLPVSIRPLTDSFIRNKENARTER